jgi:hypothetical protein
VNHASSQARIVFWQEEETETSMLNTVLSALLPMLVTFLLGFVAAWHHDFVSKDSSTLTRMVLHYAVPLALFAGTVTTSRAALNQDIPMVIALCVAIIGLYAVVFLFSRFVLRLQVRISALAALTASGPAVPLVAPVVLGDLFGGLSAIPIAIASLVLNLTVVPITIILLALDTADEDSQGNSTAAQDHSASSPRSNISVFAATLAKTVKEPIVWAPALGFVIVLSGFRIPQLIVHSLSLLGSTSGGVALFACGIVLASSKIKVNSWIFFFVFLKNVMQPALALCGLRWLGYGSPIVSETVLTTAMPAMPIVIMLALQYRSAQAEAASAVFISMTSSVITIGAFIALTR